MTSLAHSLTDGASPPAPSIDLDLGRREATLDGRRLELGGRAFDLLVALAARPGSTLDAAQLQAAVWPGRVVEPSNLRVQVSQLRQRLGPHAISHQPAQGYRLELGVRHVGREPAMRLIGREHEHEQLHELAGAERLVTVAGAGGIGKTSLVRVWFEPHARSPALATAWVDLSDAAGSQLLALVSTALGVSRTRVAPGAAALGAALGARATLLVLDNAEHLAAEVASLAGGLLHAAPGLRIVVTSQVPLRLADEHVLRLGPLELPGVGEPLGVAKRRAALALLLERVRALDPAFELDTGTLAPAVELCRRLDGLPLAIELAAARVPALGIHALVRALDARLQLLRSPAHTRPQRQQTLRAALEWTHALLPQPAQAVFARLGVFRGAFDLDAAVEVAGDEPDEGALDRVAVIEALGVLHDSSMLMRHADARYRLLETPRLYALQCLHDGQEQQRVRERHLRWCMRWLERDAQQALRQGQGQLHAALDWAMSGGDPVAGAALAQRLVAHPELFALADVDKVTESTGDDDSLAARTHGAGSGVAAASDGDGELARLLERLRAAGALGQARRAGLDAEALEALARRLRPQEMRSVDAGVREVEQAVELARQALSTPGDGPVCDAQIDAALADVAQHVRQGRFDECVDRLDEALAELERGEAERRRAYAHSRRRLLESAIANDLLRRDAFSVARRTQTLLEIDAPDAPTESAGWHERERQALERGRASAGLLWLQVAAELMRRRAAATRTALERAAARRGLAEILVELAGRDTRPSVPLEAVELCRESLTDLDATRPHARGDAWRETWGGLQQALAGALMAMGQSSGGRSDLEQARSACEAALGVRTRSAMPLAWAETQHTLGMVLRLLASLEPGTELLEQAVHCLNQALLERTARRAPLERARTLNALGIVMSIWAAREAQPERHFEALAIYQSGLALVTPDNDPLRWSQICNGIGIEYNQLASAGIDSETHWRSAISSYRRALSVATRESMPVMWCVLSHNLGESLSNLGARLSDPELLAQACTAFEDALLENTRSRPVGWSASTTNLGIAMARRGRLTPGAAGAEMISQGIQKLQSALVVRQRATMPNEWLRNQGDIAQARLWLGQHTSDRRAVSATMRAARALLADPEVEQMPRERAQIESVVTHARQWLAERSPPDRSA